MLHCIASLEVQETETACPEAIAPVGKRQLRHFGQRCFLSIIRFIQNQAALLCR